MQKIKSIALLLCFCLILQSTPLAKANDKKGAETWGLSGIELSHTSLSFQIRSVDHAQNATLYIQTSDYYSSIKEEEIISYEIPFSISSSTENITVDIPNGGYLTPGHYYDVYVKDGDGNASSSISRAYLNEHHYIMSYNAYPNWIVIKNQSATSYHASAIVAFQEYKIDLDAEETRIIEYPNQTIGTAIEIKWWDDYGCSDKYTAEVKNEYLNIPILYVWKDSVTALYPNMSKDERIAVEVEGKTYYSSYGAESGIIPDFVTYPQVADSTSKTKIWVESKNGSKSEPKEYEIQDCELDDCGKTCNAFPAEATGSVKSNDYGNSITKVATTIDSKEYSCNVANDGTFRLKYPEQKHHSSINIRFIDKHGCETSSKYTINNTLYGQEYDITTLLSRAYAEVHHGVRIAVKIDEQIYYSDYAPYINSFTTSLVTASYPMQKPGKKISVWYEKADTSRSPINVVTLAQRKYHIYANVRTSSIMGEILESREYNVYVQVNGKEYTCATKKMDYWSEDNKEYNPSDYEDDDLGENAEGDYYVAFSCSFPKQKLGNTIKVIVRDLDGYEYSQSFVMNNIKPKIKLKKINTSTTAVQGTTIAKSAITVKVKNKKYKGVANKYGDFSIKIKQQKAGTKVSVNVVTSEGYTNSITTKISKAHGYAGLSNYVFRTSTKAKLTVTNGAKGDKLKIKIGKRIYTKKLKSNKKKQKIQVGIKKAATGSKIKITLYDKFGAKKGTDSDMVYYGKKIYVGMSARNATLTTWGSPVRRNNWGTGYKQWVFESGNSTLYAYIKNGKVCNIQHLNY